MFCLESLVIAVLHFDFQPLNALVSERSACIGHSILVVSCQTMWFNMLTHSHLSITAFGRLQCWSERMFTLYWIHCSPSNSDLSAACVCHIKPTWACSPGGWQACQHIFTRCKEGFILYVMRQTHQNIPSHNMLCRLFSLSRHICLLMLKGQTHQCWLICVTSSQGSTFERASRPRWGRFRGGRTHCTLNAD